MWGSWGSWIRTAIAPMCVAVMLSAPALKARFPVNEVSVYYIPFSVFILWTLCTYLFSSQCSVKRVSEASITFFIFSAVLFSFIIGGLSESDLLVRVGMNCGLAFLVALYPWERLHFHVFLASICLISALLSVYTIMFLGTNSALASASEEQRLGYLTVSVVIGFGCIGSMFFLVRNASYPWFGIFVVCWVGLVLSRGRGALIFCVFISVTYLIYMLWQNKKVMRLRSKIAVVTLIGVSFPFVAARFFSLDNNIGRWTRLLNDSDRSLDTRRGLMEKAIEMIQSSPIFGHGLGKYLMYEGHPHNLVLQFGVDGGFIAVALLFFFIYKVYSKALSCISSGIENINLVCVLLALFSFIVLNMMKSSDAYLAREWFLLSALILAFYSYINEPKGQ